MYAYVRFKFKKKNQKPHIFIKQIICELLPSECIQKMHLTRHRVFFLRGAERSLSIAALQYCIGNRTNCFLPYSWFSNYEAHKYGCVPTGNLLAGISASRDHNLSARTEFNRHEIKRQMRRSSADTPRIFA